MKFPYVRSGESYLPVIPLTLRHGDVRMATVALVDSGAASSLFDAELAEALGIDHLEDGGRRVEFEGVSGHRLVGYIHEVTLEVGGNRFPRVPIAFSRELPDSAVNILGQQGFFDLFPITFTYRTKEIDLLAGGIQPPG